jgi:L-aminopeptidase/D-esterase-like protein
MPPGSTNSIADVAGIRVGHATLDQAGWLTGCTVVLTPEGGAVGGVDVRGGGPGTRETDLLDPANLVDRVDAVLLGGGSAFGLAAADGVMAALFADGRGWPTGGPGEVVPIVPAAILFDLGRGGVYAHHPGAADGAAAYAVAAASPVGQAVAMGSVGAGTGARAGAVKGGVGSASVILPGGATVSALVAVNSLGSPVDETTGGLHGAREGLPGEFPAHPSADEVRSYRQATAKSSGDPPVAGRATTIGVVATDAALTKAQCRRAAGIGHDGLARAIRPVHTLYDGDTLFALATCSRPAPDLPGLVLLMEAGATCVARAVAHALLAAQGVDRRADGGALLPGYRDLFPSVKAGSLYQP